MVVVVMGVTGSGKTTVGTLLARQLGWSFADADDFHSDANKQKIHAGIALTDADRAPWITALHDQIVKWITQKQNAVLACSALKDEYREELSAGPEIAPQVKFVYLKGSYDLIRERLLQRHGHFADEHILASQFETLEEPKNALIVDIAAPPADLVAQIRQGLALAGTSPEPSRN
jgi:gluconokinase